MFKESISGYTLTGAQGACYADPWRRIAAATIKRAVQELIITRSQKKADAILEWLRSEEAALFCEVGGLNFYKINNFFKDFNVYKKGRSLNSMRNRIYKFDHKGTYGGRA